METNPYLQKQIIYNNTFTVQECEYIINCPEYRNSLKTITNDNSYGKAMSYWIEINDASLWIKNRIMEYVHLANKSCFNFFITDLQELQLLEYTPGCFFDWHIDIAGKDPKHSRRKINTLTFLSPVDDYEGGLLTFDLNSKKSQLEQTQANMILFPSYQPHKVTPVTKGIRYALSGIIHGTHFR